MPASRLGIIARGVVSVVRGLTQVQMADSTFYKAVRMDGTSFIDARTPWQVGRITRIDGERRSHLCARGILHASDALGETLGSGTWPCRLFVVEPRSHLVVRNHHIVGAHAWKVVAELPAWQVFGPQGEQVAAVIERSITLTADEAQRLGTARGVSKPGTIKMAWSTGRTAAKVAARTGAWDAAWRSAWDAGRGAANDALRMAARDETRGAAQALVVRDVLAVAHFDVLYGPWHEALGD